MMTETSPGDRMPEKKSAPSPVKPELVKALKAGIVAKQSEARPATTAEKDLLRALEKLG